MNQIHEPMTMLTDYLAFGVCLYLFLKLYLKAFNHQLSIKLYAWSFLLVGLGAFFGGTFHGFYKLLDASTLYIIWKLTGLLLVFASFAMTLGTTIAFFDGKIRQFIIICLLLKVLFGLYLIVTQDAFKFIVLDYSIGLIYILIANLVQYFKTKQASSKFFILAVGICFLGAGVQQGKISLHDHFNHNDLYHIIQIIALFAFYQGVLLMKDYKIQKNT